MNCRTSRYGAVVMVLPGLGDLMLMSVGVQASPERGDQLVQTALQLDPEPDHGAALYRRNCGACHGVAGYGDASRVIPARAGQRQAYSIKQLADCISRMKGPVRDRASCGPTGR